VLRYVVVAALFCMAPLALAQGTADSAALAEAASKPVLAGKVDLVEGDVHLLDKNQRPRLPGLGDPLFEGESIATGANGEVHFSMEDGGYIGVRPNTRMRIVSYKTEGGADDQSVIGLLEGSFRSVTGWIAKLGGNSYMVRTPTATIGVRGTEHEPLVIPEGSKAGEPGTYDRVHLGETVIQTPQGTVNVRPNQAGFAPHRGAVRPRVLDRVPDFFRPTRNEGRFTGLHERVHAQLDQRREERRQFIEQRRKQQLEPRGERKPAVEQRQEQRKLQQEQRRQKTADERAVEDQRRERLQKQREERREQTQKARLEREQKQRELQERRREAAEKQAAKRAAKAEEREKRERARKAD
jgi:hypothetical protein